MLASAAARKAGPRATTRIYRVQRARAEDLTFIGLLATVSTAAPAAQRSDVVCLFLRSWLGVALPALGTGFAAPAFGLLTPVKIVIPAIVMLALAACGLPAAMGTHEAKAANLGRTPRGWRSEQPVISQGAWRGF